MMGFVKKLSLFFVLMFFWSCSDESDENAINQVDLIRGMRKYEYLDCDGNVKKTAWKLETLPEKKFSIFPEEELKERVDFSEFKNITTGDQPDHLFLNRFTFKIDIEDDALTMQVVEGINEIEYQFYECDSYEYNKGDREVCSQRILLEEGVVEVNVSYEAKEYDEARIIEPANRDCF